MNVSCSSQLRPSSSLRKGQKISLCIFTPSLWRTIIVNNEHKVFQLLFTLSSSTVPIDFFSYFYVSWSIRDFQRVTSWDCREPDLTLVILQSHVALTSSVLFSIASGTEKGLPGETSTSQCPPKASPSPYWMLPLEMCVNNKLDESYPCFLTLERWAESFFLKLNEMLQRRKLSAVKYVVH